METKTFNIMKTKQLISILACIVSLCSSTLLSANTDREKKDWDPIRRKNETELTIPEESFYLIVVVDTTTGEIHEDVSGYYPADTAIPVPPVTSGEVLLVQPIAFPDKAFSDNHWAE